MKRLITRIFVHLLFILTYTHLSYSQPSNMHLDFEDLAQLDALGATTIGTTELVPGVNGNALSLANATSICFPAQTFLSETQGTLQFWVKDLAANGGLWEVTSVGSNKLWGAFHFSDPTTDLINYELQTASSTVGRSNRNWSSNSSWHFVVFTWLQGSLRTEFAIYLDAISGVRPNLLGKVQLSQTSTLCLGNYANKGSAHPIIDELKSFNYVRGPSQIADDFWQYFTGCPSWPYIWRNPLNGADVDRNGTLNKYDTLHILSAIASGEAFNFLTCPNDTFPPLSYDVYADNRLSDLDAQSALTALNNTLPAEEQLTLAPLRLLTHGDANEDGNLNVADIQLILQNQTQSVQIFTNGDITGDGLVDNKDIIVARKFISQEGEIKATLPRFKIERPFTSQ